MHNHRYREVRCFCCRCLHKVFLRIRGEVVLSLTSLSTQQFGSILLTACTQRYYEYCTESRARPRRLRCYMFFGRFLNHSHRRRRCHREMVFAFICLPTCASVCNTHRKLGSCRRNQSCMSQMYLRKLYPRRARRRPKAKPQNLPNRRRPSRGWLLHMRIGSPISAGSSACLP